MNLRNSPLQIMFLGTASNVGKSIIATGFCRILRRRGYSVAPFKAQNLSLNSFVTMDGAEMGRSQVTQAKAADIQPSSDMNPLLLKPSGLNMTQVIVQGEVMDVSKLPEGSTVIEYVLPKIMESYCRLRDRYDALILEGAGSTSEMNLRDRDLVNIDMALRAHAPVVIVADIDRGGVFASLLGTLKLLARKERKLVIGTIINKFRGDTALFASGVNYIEGCTKKPVFGVLPYINDLGIPEEDSVSLIDCHTRQTKSDTLVRIAVIHLPHIANHTDFDPLALEQGVELNFVNNHNSIRDVDIVILPGTKNTIEDLLWLKRLDFAQAIIKHIRQGKTLVGICGGFQMLGEAVEDPQRVESDRGKTDGLSIFKLHTVLDNKKTLTRVSGICTIDGISRTAGRRIPIQGYEIHMGVSRGEETLPHAFHLNLQNGKSASKADGVWGMEGKVWGTYIHGLFENDLFRRSFLQLHGYRIRSELNYRAFLDGRYNDLADVIERHIDVDRLLWAAGLFSKRASHPLK